MSSATVFPTSGEVLTRVDRAKTGTRLERRYLAAPSPWSHRNLWVSGALMLLGGIGMLIGWYGISREITFREQTDWLVLSILSTVVVVVGLSTTLIAGFRGVRRGQRQIAADFRAHFALAPLDARVSGASAHAGSDARVTLVGLDRVHLTSCPMVEGKAVKPLDAAQLQDPNLRACGVCRP